MMERRRRRNEFSHENVVITLRNLYLSAQMDALVHPYQLIKDRAAEALPVYRDAISRLSPEMNKNSVLNMLAKLNPPTMAGVAVIPVLRTPITSGRLDTVSSERSFDAAKELCKIGRSIETDDELEYRRWDWIESAIEQIEESGKAKGVHFDRLAEVSVLAVNQFRTE